MEIIDGKKIAAEIKETIKAEIATGEETDTCLVVLDFSKLEIETLQLQDLIIYRWKHKKEKM